MDSSPAEVAVAVLIGHAAMLRCSGEDSLLAVIAAIPDPRDKRGIRHSLPSISGLCTSAVLSRFLTLTEITD
ncbi:hypothetical protein ACFHYQ_09075 [Sphaerimonospora cavernae]|uniref:Uncharacterized protein n=1 Tax=Sphaerimonospora cavernae TaxID=1740611 RepID=A0ABV6U5N6_9ACTN